MCGPCRAPADPCLRPSRAGGSLWAEAGRAVIQTFLGAGVHVRMGRMLLSAFMEAGLGVPTLMEESAIGGGSGYAGYAWLANTLRSLEPLSRKVGVAAPDLNGLTERIRDDAVARQLMVWGPPLVGAWATKA